MFMSSPISKLVPVAALSLVLGLPVVVSADRITVCWDGSGDYLTIQAGIDAATDGDEVVVCDGVYTGPGNKNLDFGGKAITVRSENGPDNCTIDCEGDGRGFTFDDGETADAVVDGFTITNGDVGAIHCNDSSPTIHGCMIVENTRGGISCWSSEQPTQPVIDDCVIVRNTTDWIFGGGGIQGVGPDCTPLIRHSVIAENVAAEDWREWNGGGGVSCHRASSVLISDCLIAGNIRTGVYNGGGGAIGCFFSSTATLVNCTITGNGAVFGGGFECIDSELWVIGCTIAGNAAFGHEHASGGAGESAWADLWMINCCMAGNSSAGTDFGGGGLEVFAYPTRRQRILNCLMAGNAAAASGGAVHCSSNANLEITNSTLVANSAASGRGLACGWYDRQSPSDVSVRNCVFWNGGDEIWNIDDSTISVSYSDVQAGWPGYGNIDADPLFSVVASGTWTADGAYDHEAYQVTLVDDTANWTQGEMIGKLLNPATTQPLQFPIVANTATTITVWADWDTIDAGVSWVTGGMSYEVHDYHLPSGSPCIDAGCNMGVPRDFADLDDDGDTTEITPLDLDGEGRFFDDPGTDDTGGGCPPIVDMGAYEFGDAGPQPCPGDLDCDREVGHSDLAILLSAWHSSDEGDLNCDGVTGHADLGILLGNWGNICP